MGKFDEHVIPDLMPANELHLIGGASGSGKTTLAFQLMQIMHVGGEWLGKMIEPQKSIYIACDRSKDCTKRTMTRVGMPFDMVPMYGMADSPSFTDIVAFMIKAMAEHPDTKIIWIDGLASKVPGGKLNDYDTISRWLLSLTHFAKKRNVTLIGLVHASKVKEGEKFKDIRQRILGSAAWASYAETIIVIEAGDPEDPADDKRVVLICVRNGKGVKQTYQFDAGGRLVECESAAEQVQQFMLDSRMPESGSVFSTKDAIEWAKEGNQSDATAERWLRARVSDGTLEKVGRGQYRVGERAGDRASVN